MIAAVMSAMSIIAMEATIVSTAMPQIVAQLGGLKYYSWVFASYLLSQTSMTVVFGKLADTHGRKLVMETGIAIFLVGSVLAGCAWSMPAMILFRLIQGVGAAAVLPVALTIVGDLYPGHERGKVQGYLASVWAVAAVLGPVVGGLIIAHLSWSWIFWINVPIGIAAMIGFFVFLHEQSSHQRPPIDIVGAVLFTVAVSAVLVILTEVDDPQTMVMLPAAAIFCLSSAAFAFYEPRATDPMVSFDLWRKRPIVVANGTMALGSMAVMGLTTFLPIYVQGVLHQSAVIAGLALTMMLVGWPVGATLSTSCFRRFGLRATMIVGSLLLPLGGVAFVLLNPASSPWLAAAGSLLMGFSMGLVSISALVLIQEVVEPSQRGSATASNMFARNLGSTLGATILGAVLNYGFRGDGTGVAVTSDRLRRLISGDGNAIVAGIEPLLHQSLHLTFLLMFAMSLGVTVLALFVPAVQIGARGESLSRASDSALE